MEISKKKYQLFSILAPFLRVSKRMSKMAISVGGRGGGCKMTLPGFYQNLNPVGLSVYLTFTVNMCIKLDNGYAIEWILTSS